MAFYDDVLKQNVDNVFHAYDKDRSNTLGPDEIKIMLRDGYRNLRTGRQVTDDDVKCFLRAVDINHNGRITRSELIKTLKKVTQNP